MKTLTIINSENHNGFISLDTIGSNSLSFNIDLPMNAAVDRIRIKGEFDVDDFGTQKDIFLEDIPYPVNVTYHREFNFDGQRVAGTLYNAPYDLYKKAMGGAISDFDVYYHLEAITEID